MHFKILFDNYTNKKDLMPLWGFSCYIEEKKLLFDTGSNGRVLLRNAQKMGVDLKEAKYLFISHPHWDHIGGLDSVLEINPDMVVFLPKSFSIHLIRDIKKFAKEVVVIDENPTKLLPSLYSTGVMQHLEQSLIIDTPKGGVVVTGCSHPGIVNIVKRAKEVLDKDIYYAIGGFHLFQTPDSEILEIALKLKELGLECVTPTHCSGKRAAQIFKEVFKDGFKEGGVGEVIDC